MQSNNHSQIIEELSNLNPPNTEFNNKLMLNALSILGNPQNNYKVIHIAGTNGKGSTAAYLEETLCLAGFKVGKFSSPSIQVINECIMLNKILISDVELVSIYQELKETLSINSIFPSSFEMLTLIMFIYFARNKINYLILETGMGGRDDATNVVNSDYSIITNISLEHTQWLGNSLEEIAKHKCGIIKNGFTVIGDNCPELIAETNRKTNNFIIIDKVYQYATKLDYQKFTTHLMFSDSKQNQYKFELGLFGHFQARNFLCAFSILNKIGIKQDIIKQAARQTRWAGRLQRVSRYPLIIADASHNENGTKVLADSLKNHYPQSGTIIICSILKDKNISAMLNNYAQISDNIIFCNISRQPRASNPYHLAKEARHKFKQIYVIQSPELAIRIAKRMRKRLVLLSGSIYLLKNILKAV